MAGANPLVTRFDTPFGVPPFDLIERAHFKPAFEVGLAEHVAEIAAIAGNAEPPTFANTIEALEIAGETLDRTTSVFGNLASSDSDEVLQALEREYSPRFAAHWTAITSNATLFGRIDGLHGARARLGLTPEQLRVLERTHLAFVRAGAALDSTGKVRMGAIIERLSVLGTKFRQNLLADESGYELLLESESDLAGLPEFLRAAAVQSASERGHAGKHLITLSRSLIEPFLAFSDRRDLRETAFKAWTRRGEMGGATDNLAIIAEMLQLRTERARILGFTTFAAYKLDDSMAKTPAAVRELLEAVWTPAVAQAGREREKLAALAASLGHNETIEPWDWRYYAEKVRKAEFDLDGAAIKPYLALENVIAAAFHTAERLFGLRFAERNDLAVYHPDVRVFEVSDTAGRHVGLFLGDYFARASKRSGAWMSRFREQQKLKGDIRPIIVNVMSFAKGAPGESTLLSFDDARTLFHEFGHGLHGLLSDVTYPSISCTSVARDFVELPSQLFEHWLETPEILERYARHFKTGEAMPQVLLDKLRASRNFNMGFATVEYLSSALVDMEFHSLTDAAGIDPLAFERAVLARIGMPREIVMRHRTPHFAHVFSGDGYSAGYYSYMWSEVLDADAFSAFEETGDVFDPVTAAKLARFIYSAGGRQKPDDAYLAFRGKMPTVAGLLKQRGLAA